MVGRGQLHLTAAGKQKGEAEHSKHPSKQMILSLSPLHVLLSRDGPLSVSLREETSQSDPIEDEVKDGHPRLGSVTGRG